MRGISGKIFKFGASILFIYFFVIQLSLGQSSTDKKILNNPISTAVPFLTNTPDSRHGAMGDVGVATTPDANSQYLNPSKYAFAEGEYGFSVSYTPWLRQLTGDMNLAYVSGFYRIDDSQAVGSSLRYFSIRDVILTDDSGMNLANVKPNEFALDFSYSRKLSDYFSGGIALRYIHSNLSGGIGSLNFTPGKAFATDVSFFYHTKWEGIEQPKMIAVGINCSNIGSKISYDEGQTKEFLPANLRLGTTFTNEFDRLSTLAFSLDFNKLLVPTPCPDENAETTSSQPVISSLFSSFSDAPGGFKEELKEITVAAGAEYWYARKFALRTGYFNESKYKGNRKYFTVGAGVKMNFCSLDFSYLMPTSQNNPLSNTIRFTVLFDADSFRKNKIKKF